MSFTPTLAPMSRGILATCTARLAPGADPAAVRGRGIAATRARPCPPAPRRPMAEHGRGPGFQQRARAGDRRRAGGRVVSVAAVDNLTKGTAGAAVQCLNLALGLPEVCGGLPVAGSPRETPSHGSSGTSRSSASTPTPRRTGTFGSGRSRRSPGPTPRPRWSPWLQPVPPGAAHRRTLPGGRGRRAVGVRDVRRDGADPRPSSMPGSASWRCRPSTPIGSSSSRTSSRLPHRPGAGRTHLHGHHVVREHGERHHTRGFAPPA